MQVSVKKGDVLVYHQVADDSKTLNQVLAHAMSLPPGKDYELSILNNGHNMPFNVADPGLDVLVRKVNGIAIREGRAKGPVMSEPAE